MTRRTDRGAGAVADSPQGRGHTVAVVVPEPADAARLVELQPPGAEIAVVCLRAGAKDGRAALDRSLTASDGRAVAGPRVLGVDGTDDPATVAALLDALGDIAPDRLHTLDPDPVHSSFDKATGTPAYDVPAAHAETAAGVLAAARAWQTETGRPLSVDCHRALSDLRFGLDACRRYPTPVNWLSAGFDGRLTAFLPTAAGVVRNWQDAQGRWSGPEVVEGPGLLPGLLVLPDPRGLPHLFALRRTPRGDGGVDVEVVHAAQYRTGPGSLTPWHSLGGPNAADWRRGRAVGFPAAAFDGAGTLFVFVRNFGHSISWRCRPADGRWTAWQHLGGARVADDLVAVTAPHGGVEVYGRLRDTAGVVRWSPGHDGTWTEDRTLPFAPRPGTLAPAPEPGLVLFRDLHTGEAVAWSSAARTVLPLGAPEGTGPLATARGVDLDGWSYSVLLTSGTDGTGRVGAYPEGRPDTGTWWQDLGTPTHTTPAATVTRTGRLTAAAWAPGGELVLAHREERPGALAFGAWHAARG
ncbi:hypothetical protein [Streptomyces sp. N50]|uniref:hypothetical protein n=1 Tax=Streptomyces sp. N50 TaxID=3081765 RepID=UPI0029623401|nr:hypothetical protein [Streptomyces sp. N50]WOX13234.1 hypothetical protein R2B38_32375 [Streptomyces sp. N50]